MATQGRNKRAGDRSTLSKEELQQRWNDDWSKWRIRESEFQSEIKVLRAQIGGGTSKSKKPAAPSESAWDRLVKLSGYLSQGTMPVVLAVYAYWEAAGYPDPGRTFWADDAVHTLVQWGLPTVVAVALLKPALSWTLIVMIGAMMVAYMFKGY